MASYRSGDWAQARFGDVAGDLAVAVADGLREAHRLSLSAHLASELTTNDAYGAALHVAQHEQLVAATAGLPGVVARKPTGLVTRFPYVVTEEKSVVLVPWRFTTTRATRRLDARMRTPVSDLRRVLLGLSTAAASTQLVLEQSALDADELDAQLAEEEELLEQLSSFGRVVTVAFGSNPTDGLFDMGWGDAELVDEGSGHVHWHHWQPLPAAQPGERGLAAPAAARLRPVAPSDSAVARRFDSAPLNDDLGLTPRKTPTPAPVSEPETTAPRAGGVDGDGQA